MNKKNTFGIDFTELSSISKTENGSLFLSPQINLHWFKQRPLSFINKAQYENIFCHKFWITL